MVFGEDFNIDCKLKQIRAFIVPAFIQLPSVVTIISSL